MNRYIRAVNQSINKRSNYLVIFLLMLAGESIFLLPFVIPRIFRPTLMTALELDNTQLGNCFSVYGICALFSYFLGGFITDLVAPRKLMALALLLTGMGGLYMTTYPNYEGLLVLYGYWGVTTILLFWAAMIKATRIWGKEDNQGKAFGFLEAGRGAVAASIGFIGALLFAYLLAEGGDNQSLEEIRSAYNSVVLFASIFVLFVAFLVYFLLRVDAVNEDDVGDKKNPLSDYWMVLKNPAVFLLMIIILTAYVGYKSTDFIAQYANEVLGYSDAKSAQVGAIFLYLRPVTAVLIGIAADRMSANLWMKIGFIGAIIGASLFTFGVTSYNLYYDFIFSTVLLGMAIFGIRALYFALLKEGEIPIALTGLAVSLISVIGYLPDIFMGPLTGYFLDEYPGEQGFKMVFGFLMISSIIGLLASYLFHKTANSAKN